MAVQAAHGRYVWLVGAIKGRERRAEREESSAFRVAI